MSSLLSIALITHPLHAFFVSIGLAIPTIIFYLRHQLNHPTVLTYPWPSRTSSPDFQEQKQTNNEDRITTVVIAGSYNPPHYGHIEMIAYLAKRYQKVLVVIGVNKNKVYSVSPAQRAAFLEQMVDLKLAEEYKCKVKVEVVEDYIWRYAKSKNAKILFRGIRTMEKDGLEERALRKLNLWGPLVVGGTWPVPTWYLESKPEYIKLSSTSIRKICAGAVDNNTHVGDNDKDDSMCLKALVPFIPKEIRKEVALAYR